jgi:hypothetical protein
MTRMWKPVMFGAILVVTAGLASARGQQPAPHSRVAVLETPFAVRMQHKSLREELARASADKGAVGDAAREVERVLLPHLEHEEALALRPLGLMRGTARDADSAELTQVVPMAIRIERELPTLIDEHRQIGDATKRLADVSRREGKPQYQGLIDRLWLHARMAEEVLYPAAILVGEYVRISRSANATTAHSAKP